MDVVTLATLLAMLAFGVLVYALFEIRRPPATDERGLNPDSSEEVRRIVTEHRARRGKGSSVKLAAVAAADTNFQRARASGRYRMTLAKRLKFARWKISPRQYQLIRASITLMAFLTARQTVLLPLQIVTIFLTPKLVDFVLEYCVHRRFKAFDRDYPAMLLQYVSVLKSGLHSTTGLGEVARALDNDSVVRSEIEVLLESVRLGVNEQQSINAFGSDIAHPEIELFVQSLLLHQRMGGKISSTFERLARQVRLCQQFRDKAVAAVALERVSVVLVALVFTFLLVYIAVMSPELLLPAFADPQGAWFAQGSIGLIIIGFYWTTRVTKVKV